MLLSAVSVLVVAQSSSEIPEGLMNNPAYCSARLLKDPRSQEAMRLYRHKIPVPYWIIVCNLHCVSSLRRTPPHPPRRPPFLPLKRNHKKQCFQCPFVSMDFRNLRNTRTLQITASIFTITHLLITHLDLFILVALSSSMYQYFYQCTARVA